MKDRLVRAATRLLRFMPDRAAAAVGLVVADACWILLRERRRTLEENLRYTAPDRTRAERRRLGRATFRNLAQCTIDFLRIPLMKRTELFDLVDVRGGEHLDRALARGKGVILLSAHVGNWELAGPFLAAHGYPLHAYAEDAEDSTEFRTYLRYRGATGLKVIPLSHGALVGYEVLEQGDILALLGDRAIAGRKHITEFCGGRRQLPIGPAALARRSGATVLFSYLILNPARRPRYLGVIEPPADIEHGNSDDRQLTQAIADRLSRIVREYPDQWFVFQPHWLPRET